MAASIESISNFILKPCPVPNINHLPNAAVTPLTVFDRAAGNFHYPVLMAFRSTMPSNSVLTESLSRVLAPYPHLAGTIDYDSSSRPSFVLNNAGVRLVATQVNVPMDEKSLIHDPTTHGNLYPRVHDGANEVFQVQLNRYACGGMVIGFTISHTISDGYSIFQFIARWAEAARGLAAAASSTSPLLQRRPQLPLRAEESPDVQVRPPGDRVQAAGEHEVVTPRRRQVSRGQPDCPVPCRVHIGAQEESSLQVHHLRVPLRSHMEEDCHSARPRPRREDETENSSQRKGKDEACRAQGLLRQPRLLGTPHVASRRGSLQRRRQQRLDHPQGPQADRRQLLPLLHRLRRDPQRRGRGRGAHGHCRRVGGTNLSRHRDGQLARLPHERHRFRDRSSQGHAPARYSGRRRRNACRFLRRRGEGRGQRLPHPSPGAC
ncbi:tryptamine hydroxycinnamoyltransferase 2 [Iris pallida]|uniref:Tryptamine hydroxycinnamoyltransferase 2 n=1 Tax=Iris pallida TaxID=29817 RepID=A0AAX6FFR4_IRIPA|nr:tryptamine hydroxycinnamoyltransferase 2 [Iris pallida]